MSAAKLAISTISDSRGTPTGAATSIWSTTSTGASRSSPITRRCSAASSVRSIRIRATTCSRPSDRTGSDKTEVLGVLNHISRHLGDRFKPVAVAENSLGPRVMRRFTSATTTALEVRGNVRKVIARAYVDYTWMTDIDLIARPSFDPNVGVYGRAYGQLIDRGQDDRRARQPAAAADSKPAFSSAASEATWSCSSAASASSTPTSWTACLGAGRSSGFACCGTDDPADNRLMTRQVRPLPRRRAADRGDELHDVCGGPASQTAVRHLDAAQRAHAGAVGRSFDADRPHAGLVSRRLEEREKRAHRLRASLRAPDVQGLEERRARKSTPR